MLTFPLHWYSLAWILPVHYMPSQHDPQPSIELISVKPLRTASLCTWLYSVCLYLYPPHPHVNIIVLCEQICTFMVKTKRDQVRFAKCTKKECNCSDFHILHSIIQAIIVCVWVSCERYCTFMVHDQCACALRTKRGVAALISIILCSRRDCLLQLTGCELMYVYVRVWTITW